MSCGVENPSKTVLRHVLPLLEIKEQVAASTPRTKKKLFKRRSGNAAKRHGQQSAIARAVVLCRNAVFPSRSPKKSTSKKRLAASKVQAVDEFLRREDNAYQLPDKKHYKRDNANFIPVVALVDTLRNLHKKFVVETGLTISFSTFSNARDRSTIKACIFLKRSVCLCKPHANMSMMLEAVPGLPNSTSHLAAMAADDVLDVLRAIPSELVCFKMWDKEARLYKKKTVYHTNLRKVRISKSNFILKFMQDLDTIQGAPPTVSRHSMRL